MSIQQSAYQGQVAAPSAAALPVNATNLNPLVAPLTRPPYPGGAGPTFPSQPYPAQLPIRNDMPPPALPYSPSGGRAALTAALKRSPAAGGPPMPGAPGPSSASFPAPIMHRAPTMSTAAPAPVASGAQQPARKKRKTADKSLHPGIKQIVPESKAYMDLLEFEKRLDCTISRKKIEIQEALRKPQKIKKKLRIFVSHTFTPGKPETEAGDGSYPMWELRVEGRLLEDLNKQPASGSEAAKSPVPEPTKSRRKFSSFFRSLIIELDRELYGPDNHLVEWHRSASTQETDGFQVKRIGDRNVKCVIMLMLDYTPPYYKLDVRLAKLLGLIVGTKTSIFHHFWEYIKRNKLQDTSHPDYLNLDPPLQVLFNTKQIRMQEVAQRLQALLYSPDPIIIHHMITVDNSEGRRTACYDVDVDVDDPAKPHMANFFQGVSQTQEIQQLDNKICETVDTINQLRVSREFFMSFANDPQNFIARWIQSQASDLKAMTDVIGVPEAERRADHYQGDWSREAIHRYFFNKLQQRRQELEQILNIKQ